MTVKMLEDCGKKEGATADEVSNILARKTPSSKAEKCLHACIGETLGLIQNQRTNVEASVELAKMAFGPDDIRVTHAKEIATECAEITDPERCEAAVKMYQCSIAAGAKRGLKLGDLL